MVKRESAGSCTSLCPPALDHPWSADSPIVLGGGESLPHGEGVGGWGVNLPVLYIRYLQTRQNSYQLLCKWMLAMFVNMYEVNRIEEPGAVVSLIQALKGFNGRDLCGGCRVIGSPTATKIKG